MIRKIIKIDEERCNGCGACAEACHEGAIGMVNGKAKLLRDDYCDGLGDCLPACPTNAISFEEREAEAYDADAVAANMAKKKHTHNHGGGCPGHKLRTFSRHNEPVHHAGIVSEVQSELGQWPCQIRLIPATASCFDGADLLIAADCTSFAYANMHNEFMKGKKTLIGCPKLDDIDYSEKLTDIIRLNNIKSVTIVRMEVPCCKGIEDAAKKALQDSGKFIPWQVKVISVDGKLL